jgi:hypothetical protein
MRTETVRHRRQPPGMTYEFQVAQDGPDRGRQGPHTWVTLADPEGNEFCVSA